MSEQVFTNCTVGGPISVYVKRRQNRADSAAGSR